MIASSPLMPDGPYPRVFARFADDIIPPAVLTVAGSP
jgi:hypothetical protein